ncbi:ankyrin repeat protein [Colletotrichum orchidophilum]|uniref:Ankyrin repeat protein n=1 Tax=Colletotrichum orchidophilum TaxID=1209926 RepID=A0A1G4BDB3_9PEZI|nr:ankyrin repeat protein [Colletotrichum orchidophilum]OHE99394.1 ankyrin repeat protein [Colletotrichum orchidophilum]
MAGDHEEHEGASAKELLIEAMRRDNTDLFNEVIADIKDENELARILNETTTVMGNHLYHEAASRGNYDIIDLLLDQPNFECDPINRQEGDTPLHTAIRWINNEPLANREFGNALVDMMLEAGSNPRVKNKGGLTPLQLVDPRNPALRDLIQKHEYASLNAGDFINVDSSSSSSGKKNKSGAAAPPSAPPAIPNSAAPPVPPAGYAHHDDDDESDDDDAEFSGSDDDERAEWDRRRKERAARKG